MTKIDWIIVGFAAFTAVMGFRQGLVRSILALLGLTLGAVVGARVAPHLLHHGAHSPYTAVIGFVGALVGASVLHTAAASIGGLVRSTLRFAPPLRLLDSAGGLLVGAAWGLVLAWVVGAVAIQLPGHPNWHRDARRSHVLQHLNQVAPPRDVLKLRAALLEKY
jgi:uncharacterized membrane protein required for colicin V production